MGFTRLGESEEPKLIKRLRFHSGHSLIQLNMTVITLHELIGVIGPVRQTEETPRGLQIIGEVIRTGLGVA